MDYNDLTLNYVGTYKSNIDTISVLKSLLIFGRKIIGDSGTSKA